MDLFFYNRPVLALKHVASGKVREIYEVDGERLLFVATDRISARSEEHTSELQSHSFISYAVFCLKKKNI